ncbi:MAG: NADH-quinone oxidoreductase subunit I [Myxococcales bacterium]|nr:NADH-quinone oxidoreductase subunit I [Myxococcales bacterium]
MGHHAEAPEESTEALLVLSVSKKNKNIRTVQVNRPEPEQVNFLPALAKGLGITLKHFFGNVVARKHTETMQYPEETKAYPERNRGLHRLMLREDDTERCVACMCCPTVCPANCITIVPAERDDAGIEKRPAIFEIDELRCVVCGLCVESCPCDAIRMDTGVHATAVEHRHESVMDKSALLKSGTKSIAVQGGTGPNWRK